LKQLEQSNHGYSTSNAQNLTNNVIEERLYNDLQQPMEKKKPIGMYTTQVFIDSKSTLSTTNLRNFRIKKRTNLRSQV